MMTAAHRPLSTPTLFACMMSSKRTSTSVSSNTAATFAVCGESPAGSATGRQVSAVRPGSGSGSASRHRKGLSIAQIRSGEDLLEPWQRIRRVLSEIHEKLLPADAPASASAFTIGATPGTGLAVPDPSQSKTSLLSPTPSDVTTEKNRRYMLTVMVEPFSRMIKNWKRKTPRRRRPPRPPLPLHPRHPRQRVWCHRLRRRIARSPFFPAWTARMHTRPATILHRPSRPQCYAVVQTVQWCQARCQGYVYCGRRQHQHHQQGEGWRAATADAACAWRYPILLLEGQMAAHDDLAGRVGFFRLSSNRCSLNYEHCCERRAAHLPWCGGPGDDHDAPHARGH